MRDFLPKEHHLIKGVVLRFAKRYIAGYTISSVLKEARDNSNRDVHTTVTFLNDDVDSPVKARYNSNAYVQLARQASRLNLKASISLRPAQMGLNLNHDVLDRCLSDVVAACSESGTTVWLEAEKEVPMERLFEVYRHCRQSHANVGIEIPVWYPLEVVHIKKHLKKGDSVKLTSYSYSSDVRLSGSSDAKADKAPSRAKQSAEMSRPNKTEIIALYTSSIGKLLQAGVGVVVLDHDEGTLARLAGFSKEYKKNLIFELPLGYSKGWFSRLMKMKIRLSVYAPYGRDWTPYIVNKLTASHGRIREIAARVLDADGKSVIDGKKTEQSGT